MITKFVIKKVDHSYYITSEWRLYSTTELENMVVSLLEDRLWSEASWYAARTPPVWIQEISDTSYTPFAALPPQARKRVKPEDRRRIERGTPIKVLACIY